MSLGYDFDMFDVVPGSNRSDPALDSFMTEIGYKVSRFGNKVALFRDPRTAEALRAAPAELRDFFLASGFGLNTYASGAPKGRYPAKDEEARLDVIRRLTDHAETHPLPKPEELSESGDAFRLGEFLSELARSEPIEEAAGFSQSHDLTGHTDARDHVLPPMFDTMPLAPKARSAEDATAAPRKKFWQSRFFLMAAAAGLVAAIVHLASGPVFLELASL